MGPIHELKCIFNTIYVDILRGKSLPVLTQMFQCVKEVSANTHRELTKKITRRGGFQRKTDEVIARLFSIRWKLPVLSIYFLWKIEDQRKYFSRVFPFKYNRGFLFFFSIIMSLFPFHMFIHILIKYVLCDIHCHNYSNSSQHLYILYYATQQDRCSMPVCTHKKAYGSVHVLQLRNIQLSEVLEAIFLRLSYATNI